MPIGEHVTVIVWHHRLPGLARANLFAADDERDLDALLCHLLEPILERLFLRRASDVALDRLVHWCRNAANAGESGEGCGRRRNGALGLLGLSGSASGRAIVALALRGSDGCGRG